LFGNGGELILDPQTKLAGLHKITARVTDSDAIMGEDSVDINFAVVL
jgi:hypothetical protein